MLAPFIVMMDIWFLNGFLTESGNFSLEYSDAKLFEKVSEAKKAIKIASITQPKCVTYRIIRNYGFENELVIHV